MALSGGSPAAATVFPWEAEAEKEKNDLTILQRGRRKGRITGEGNCRIWTTIKLKVKKF